VVIRDPHDIAVVDQAPDGTWTVRCACGTTSTGHATEDDAWAAERAHVATLEGAAA
jgi:hypothetical protein